MVAAEFLNACNVFAAEEVCVCVCVRACVCVCVYRRKFVQSKLV